MKKYFIIGFISLIVLSSMTITNAFSYSDYTSYCLCWYNRHDSTICRNISNIKNSIVKYGNSKKPWSTSEAEQIQDKWFLLNKDTAHKYSNVMVKYTFNSTGDPNFTTSPWLAGGTPLK